MGLNMGHCHWHTFTVKSKSSEQGQWATLLNDIVKPMHELVPLHGSSFCDPPLSVPGSPFPKSDDEDTMISVLAQERLLGAALGSASVGMVVLEQRKRIYNSIYDERSKIAAKSKVSGKQSGSGSEFALLWNKAVDQIFVPVIESLSSRRW